MGFNYFNKGAMLSCSIVEGHLRYVRHDGVIHTIDLKINKEEHPQWMNLNPQCNGYVSPNVLFLLRQSYGTVVGRADGMYTLYDRDMIPISMKSIEIKPPKEYNPIGYATTIQGIESVHLIDERFCFTNESGIVFVLDRPFNNLAQPQCELALALLTAQVDHGIRDVNGIHNGLFVYDWKGERYASIKSSLPPNGRNNYTPDRLQL